MKTLLALLLLTTTAHADRYFICESKDGNSSLIRQDSTTCNPKKIKREYKQFLELGYIAEFQKYSFGSKEEALKEARDTYKGAYCRFVDLTITEE